MSQSSVTEKRTVITSSSSSGGYENLEDIPYKSNLGTRSNIISRSSLPIHAGGGSQLVRTMEYNYGSSMGGMPHGGFTNVSNTGVTTVKSSREKEKKDLRDLNERFANYIEKVRFLEAQNRKLGSELDELRSKWGKETSHIKQMYEAELAEARRLIDDLSKDKAALEIKSSSILEQNADIQRQLDEAKKYRNQDRETINKLNQQLADYESEINMLRRSIESLETERSRDKGTINRLQQEVDKLRIDLNNETLAHLDAENRRQTLEEEMEFMKKVHEQELKELAALAYRDTTAENREFWKSELAQAIRDIQNEYDAKVDAIRGDMEAFYNLKIQEYRTGATKQNMEVTHIREENKKMVKQMSELRSKLTDMEARNAQLEKQYQDVLRELESKDTDHMMETTQLREEISKLRAEMEGILTELQTLMDAKLSLELEIAAYRKLLEGEENRVDWRSRASMIMYRDAFRPRSTYERSYPEDVREKPVERKPDRVELKPEAIEPEKPVESKPEPFESEKTIQHKQEPVVSEKRVEHKAEPVVIEKPVELKAEAVVSAKPASPEPHDVSPDTDAASCITMSDQDMSPKGEHPDMDIADIDEVEVESSGEGKKIESSDISMDKGKTANDEPPTDHFVLVKEEVKKIESRAKDVTDGTESPDHSPDGNKSPVDVAIKRETTDIAENKPSSQLEETNKSDTSEHFESKTTTDTQQTVKESPLTVEQVPPVETSQSIPPESVESIKTESTKPIDDTKEIDAKEKVQADPAPASEISRNKTTEAVDGENNQIRSTEVETKHDTNEKLHEQRSFTPDVDKTSPSIEAKTQESIETKPILIDQNQSYSDESKSSIGAQEDSNDKQAPETTTKITDTKSETSEKFSSSTTDTKHGSQPLADKSTVKEITTEKVVSETADDSLTTQTDKTYSTLDTLNNEASQQPEIPESQIFKSDILKKDAAELVTDLDNVERELEPTVKSQLSSPQIDNSIKAEIVQDKVEREYTDSDRANDTDMETKAADDKNPEKATNQDVPIMIEKMETGEKDISNVKTDSTGSDLQKSIVNEKIESYSADDEIIKKENDTVEESVIGTDKIIELSNESSDIKSNETAKPQSSIEDGNGESKHGATDKIDGKVLSPTNQTKPENEQQITKPNSLLPDTLGKTEDKILETVVKSEIIEKSPQEQSLIVEASPSKELPDPFPETTHKNDQTQLYTDENKKDTSPNSEINETSISTEAIEDDKTPDETLVDTDNSKMQILQESKTTSDKLVTEQKSEKTDDTEKDPLIQAMKSPEKSSQEITKSVTSSEDVQHVDQVKDIESESKTITTESKSVSNETKFFDTEKQDLAKEVKNVESEKQAATSSSGYVIHEDPADLKDGNVNVESKNTKTQVSETETEQNVKNDNNQMQMTDNDIVDTSRDVTAVKQDDIIISEFKDTLSNKSMNTMMQDHDQTEKQTVDSESLKTIDAEVSKIEKGSGEETEATSMETINSQIETKQEVKVEHSEKQDTLKESTATPEGVSEVKKDIVSSEKIVMEQEDMQTETKEVTNSNYEVKQKTVSESATEIEETPELEEKITGVSESKDTKDDELLIGERKTEVITDQSENVTPVTESTNTVHIDSVVDSSSKNVDHNNMPDKENQESEGHPSENQNTDTALAKVDDTLTKEMAEEIATTHSSLVETKMQEYAQHESHDQQKSTVVSSSVGQSKSETETTSKASSDVAIAQSSSIKQTTDSELVSSGVVKQQATTESVSKVEAKSDVAVKETTSIETSKSVEASQSKDFKSENKHDEQSTSVSAAKSQESIIKESVTVSKESHQTESSSEAHLSKTSSESSTVVNGKAEMASATTDVKAEASISQTQETKAIQQTDAVSEKSSQIKTEQHDQTTEAAPAKQKEEEPAVNGEVEKAVEPATKTDDALTEKIEKLLLNGDVGLKRVVEQVVNTQSSGGEMLSEIVSGYENRGDSQVSMKMMRGEVSAKTTYQRTSTGPIAISEVAADGKYIVLENTSSGPKRQDVNLDGWKLRRTVDGTRDYTYNFRNFTLKAGKSVKILARSAASEAGLNDLVFRDEDTWGFGSQVKTSLINDKSEEKASHVQKTLYN